MYKGYLWDVEVDPASDAVRLGISEMKWDLTVFDRPHVVHSPYALFVDFAVHHLDLLIKKYDGEMRYRLVSLLDCYLPMVNDILSDENSSSPEAVRAQLGKNWWVSRKSIDWRLTSVPNENSLDIRSTSRIVVSTPIFTQFNPDKGVKSDDEKNGVDQLIKSAWAQKHRMEHFIGSCLKLASQARSETQSSRSPAVFHAMQWWCLFKLGMYRHGKTPVLDLAVRMKWVLLWNQLDTEKRVFCADQFGDVLKTPVQFLFAVKEFTLFCVKSHRPLYDLLVERTTSYGDGPLSWDRHHLVCVDLIDRFRETGEDGFGEYMKTQYSIGLLTKSPAHYWDHVDDYLIIPSDRLKTAISTDSPVSTTLIYDCVSELMDRQEDLYRMPPLPEDSYQLVEIHPAWHPLFLFSKRVVQWILYWLGACEESVQLCVYSLVRYYTRRCGKNSTNGTIALLMKRYPRTYFLWYHLIKSRIKWRFVRQVPLPLEVLRVQLDAFEYNCPDPSPYNIDYILYCPNCGKLCSVWVPKFERNVPLPRRAQTLSGFTGMVVDCASEKWYCGRKTGLNAPICNKTELQHVRSRGRMTFLGARVLVNCDVCARLMVLGPDAKHYASPSWMCTICIRDKARKLSGIYTNWLEKERKRLEAIDYKGAKLTYVPKVFPMVDWVKRKRSFLKKSVAMRIEPETQSDLLYAAEDVQSDLRRILGQEKTLLGETRKRKA